MRRLWCPQQKQARAHTHTHRLSIAAAEKSPAGLALLARTKSAVAFVQLQGGTWLWVQARGPGARGPGARPGRSKPQTTLPVRVGINHLRRHALDFFSVRGRGASLRFKLSNLDQYGGAMQPWSAAHDPARRCPGSTAGHGMTTSRNLRGGRAGLSVDQRTRRQGTTSRTFALRDSTSACSFAVSSADDMMRCLVPHV